MDNVFTMGEKRFLKAHGVDDLVFSRNRYRFDAGLPQHVSIGETGVELTNCMNVQYEETADETVKGEKEK